MSTTRGRMLFLMAMATLLAACAGAWAQESLTATLAPTGLISVSRGETGLATIELSAHGPGWQHAAQTTATAQASALPGGAGVQFVGTLPIPATEAGALRYTESVQALPQGLRLGYDVTVAAAMKLCGLQVSVNLPVAQYAGKELVASEPRAQPQIVALPLEQPQNFQLWSGQAAKVEAAAGTDLAVTVELRAATDVVVQDLRQWQGQVYEIRFPAIMEGEGRDVAVGDRFHLDLTVSFGAPVTLAGP